jgi:hypothetical protein
MRFRTVAIAAAVLVVGITGAFAAFQVGEDARAEAAQQTIEANDSLAVEPGYRQQLQHDQDHDPTTYGPNGTETVEYNGTVWEPDGNYTYYPESGEIEFLRDENGSANISYQYDIPADQAQDEQLQTSTEGFAQIQRVAIGLAFVVLLLFIGGFAAAKIRSGGRSRRGR